MEYLFKHQLTNNNRAIQNKARYFADTLIFLHAKPCQFGFAPMESHRSLLSKIGLRLKYYHGNTSGKYIDHYISNPLLHADDTLISQYYTGAVPLLDEIRNQSYKNDAAKRAALIIKIDDQLTEFEDTLFQYALDEVITILHCPEDLERHNHIEHIEYAAGILNAELNFIGFPQKDANQIFERILSKEVTINNNKVLTPFPLPAEILAKRKQLDNDEDYFNVVSEFLEKRTLKEQFQGIYNLYRAEDRECKLLFRITNLKSKKRLSKTYGNVKLTTHYKSYILRKMNASYKGLLSEKDQVFLEVVVHADDMDSANVMALEHINKELPLFEQYFHTRLQVNLSDFIMKNNEGYFFKLSLASKWLIEYSTVQMQLERAMKKTATPAAKDFQYFERLYAFAETSALPDQKVNYYWRYIESAFNGSDANANKIMDSVAMILANYRVTRVLYPYITELANMLIANGEGIEGPQGPLTYMQIKDIVHQSKWSADWLTETNCYANSPFIGHHLTTLLDVKVEELHGQIQVFYRNILTEAYEQRNYIQHDSTFHPMALLKLTKVLPAMVHDLRYLISREIIKKRDTIYPEVINTLIQPDLKLKRMFKMALKVSDL